MKKAKAIITVTAIVLSIGAYGCSPSASRDDVNINPITGKMYNNTNSFSIYNTTDYYSNGTVNISNGKRVLDNTVDVNIDGTDTFTSNIINKYTLSSNKVAKIRKGMSYDEVLEVTEVAPYFKNQSDAALANNKKNGITYYFVNGRALKIYFVNGIVERVYY